MVSEVHFGNFSLKKLVSAYRYINYSYKIIIQNNNTTIQNKNFSGAKLPAGGIRSDPLHHPEHLQSLQRVRCCAAQGGLCKVPMP
jgi:hypothetical protein